MFNSEPTGQAATRMPKVSSPKDSPSTRHQSRENSRWWLLTQDPESRENSRQVGVAWI